MFNGIKKFVLKHQKSIIIFIGSCLASICYNLKYSYNLPIVHDIVIILICVPGIILKITNKNEKVDNVLEYLFYSFMLTDLCCLIIRLIIKIIIW